MAFTGDTLEAVLATFRLILIMRVLLDVVLVVLPTIALKFPCDEFRYILELWISLEVIFWRMSIGVMTLFKVLLPAYVLGTWI